MKKILKFVVGIVIILTLVQIVVSNNLSTTGVALGNLDDQIAQYRKENAILREKLLTESSLTNISQKAEKLGFLASKTTVVQSFAPIALKP